MPETFWVFMIIVDTLGIELFFGRCEQRSEVFVKTFFFFFFLGGGGGQVGGGSGWGVRVDVNEKLKFL